MTVTKRTNAVLGWPLDQPTLRSATVTLRPFPGSDADAIFDVAISSVDLAEVNVHAASGEIGYWLAPAARGAGMMIEAIQVLSGWALTSDGLNRIEFRVDPEEEPSMRLMERLGAVREGLLCQLYRDRAGVFRDKAVYSFIRGDDVLGPSASPFTIDV
jgi:RimJ/RimL family protein N-acetyltransferase